MPLFSVTAIGLLAAAVAGTTFGVRPLRALLLGVAGAWGGFLGGALVGVVVDVLAGTGHMLAITGHAAAVAVAAIAVWRVSERGSGAPRGGESR